MFRKNSDFEELSKSDGIFCDSKLSFFDNDVLLFQWWIGEQSYNYLKDYYSLIL